MSKFNTGPVRQSTSRRTSPVQSTARVVDATTHQGGFGYTRTPESELFLLGVSLLVGEESFYETANERTKRFVSLIHSVTKTNSFFVAEFLKWLRQDANIRTASVVGAIEYGRTWTGKDVKGADISRFTEIRPRTVLASVLRRPDEPGEALAYWLSTYGKPLPKWLKRGLGDAILAAYNEFTVLKYDSDRNPIRFADVLEYTQIKGEHDKNVLFKYLLDARHGRGSLEGLPVLAENKRVNQLPREEARKWLLGGQPGERMGAAGMTWESLSGLGAMDANSWTAIVPRMGYMALLRNLRNLDEAGVSLQTKKWVRDRLTDPKEVAKSQQFPLRFLSAYDQMLNDFWKPVLDEAAELSVSNIPEIPGNWLIMVDTSGSMDNRISNKSTMKRWRVASLFGIAFARRVTGKATVVSYSAAHGYYDQNAASREFPLKPGENLLAATDRFKRDAYIGHGTDTVGQTGLWFNRVKPDHVLILTDEQVGAFRNYSSYATLGQVVPDTVPLYTFNLAGYQVGQTPSGEGNRHTFGGLTDAGFRLIREIEAGRNGKWPWETKD